MLRVECDLVGKSPISFSRPLVSAKNTGEGHADFEERTWRERMHVMPDGEVFFNPTGLKLALSGAAKYLSESVPGKGKATYTKHFDAGVQVSDPLMFGVQADDVDGEWYHVPSDGRKGGTSRVMKCFPVLPAGWRTHAILHVFDPILKADVIERYLKHAGMFIGLGRFRPRNGGWYGQFDIENFESVES